MGFIFHISFFPPSFKVTNTFVLHGVKKKEQVKRIPWPVPWPIDGMHNGWYKLASFIQDMLSNVPAKLGTTKTKWMQDIQRGDAGPTHTCTLVFLPDSS